MSVPSVVLDTTLAGENSNSYVDVATCDDYWTTHWSRTKADLWLSLTPPQKTNLLIQACRVIETARFVNSTIRSDYHLRYSMATKAVLNLPLQRDPVKYYWYQRLQFPRNLDIHAMSGPSWEAGNLYVPDPILWAQCEQAAYLLSFDETAMATRLQGVTLDKLSIGKNQVSTTQEFETSGSMYAPTALEMVRPFMVKNGRSRRG